MNGKPEETFGSESVSAPSGGEGETKGTRKRPVARQTRRLRSAPMAGEHSLGGMEVERKVEGHYGGMVKELRAKYKISIRKWRTDMAGVAYELSYQDGRIKRLIAAPKPRSPVSAAIFLHEVGHHAIGFKRYGQRCLEEEYVWRWTFREMQARQIPVTARVLRHYRRSMHHYVKTALRHGEQVPGELGHFAEWPG